MTEERTEPVNPSQEQEGQPKIVWIKCRAHPDCPGTRAYLVSKRSNSPIGRLGEFNASQGGNFIRYRCLTCSGTFHISS